MYCFLLGTLLSVAFGESKARPGVGSDDGKTSENLEGMFLHLSSE